MPERLGSYRSIPAMDNENAPVLKKFFVFCTGRTNGAHQPTVQKLQRLGQIETMTSDECDYLLVFCPITSRVGTDVGEAMDQVDQNHGNKPVILVVMHHTFDPERVVADSGRHVQNANVFLTVDTLFYEDKFLACNRNDIALDEIRRSLRISQPYRGQTTINCPEQNLKYVFLGAIVLILLIVLAVVLTLEFHK